jgi:GDP-mannose pyrophosphatase NudK
LTNKSSIPSKIKIISEEILHQHWSKLSRYIFDYTLDDGSIQRQTRVSFDRGNGATALLYNPAKQTVVLTRQFRLPTYLNGNSTGMLIETCAGTLENEAPREAMLREIEEETGYRINQLEKIFEAYMSPGSVTEILHFYIAYYTEQDRVSSGGGIESEHENIEVLEMTLTEAMNLINTGEIRDGKTIMLLQYAQNKFLASEKRQEE